MDILLESDLLRVNAGHWGSGSADGVPGGNHGVIRYVTGAPLRGSWIQTDTLLEYDTVFPSSA